MEKLIEKTPCPRVVNGFRLIPEDVSSGFLWSVTPNMSPRKFCFTQLSLAEDFCHKYVNYHSEHYWFRLWLKNPIYHFCNVEKLVDSISYML